MSELLELDSITQIFKTRRGEVRAVDDVTLKLNAGGVLCLVGQSGSGKSTTAKIASGLARSRPRARCASTDGDIYARGRGHRRRFTELPAGRAVRPPGSVRLAQPDPGRLTTLAAPLWRARAGQEPVGGTRPGVGAAGPGRADTRREPT